MDSDGVLNSMYGRDAEDGRVIGGRGHIIIKKTLLEGYRPVRGMTEINKG